MLLLAIINAPYISGVPHISYKRSASTQPLNFPSSFIPIYAGIQLEQCLLDERHRLRNFLDLVLHMASRPVRRLARARYECLMSDFQDRQAHFPSVPSLSPVLQSKKREQFSACGACRMRRFVRCRYTPVNHQLIERRSRVRCDLKDLPVSPSGQHPPCSNCNERGLKCV